uniref:Cytochrome P450 n=2 Tax=Oryza TaxID=4527 RepID=Q6EP96_ORYSJ|nr:putative cytochrome P450 [Oryza sativa Japonica Group]BAD29524.1 putative cytochrome P450 [Oryza sativa Japonica Group]
METLVCVAVWAVAMAMVVASVMWAYRWSHPRANGRLPPGSLGLPLLGETLQFFAPNTTCDISPFVKERLNRYGSIFKTSVVGRPVVVTADPEMNYYVFQQEGKLFESWYPDTFTEIFGRDNVGSLHGFMYKYLKSLVLRLYGQENLRAVLLDETDRACRTSLASWAAQPSVELKDSISAMIFDLTAKKLISYEPSKSSENLRKNFVAFIRGLISFPVDIPGTAYHECMKGRRNAMKVLKKMMRERMEEPGRQCEDFFDVLIEELGREKPVLTEGIALDLMFVLLFASFETTSLALTLGVRLLAENPTVLDALTEEHEAIVRGRKEGCDAAGLTWADYKSMTFTSQVTLEMVRLANIVPGIFRKALQDIEFKGYTIPAGWGVMVCPPAVHLNPEIYEDPLAFNPWRWQMQLTLVVLMLSGLSVGLIPKIYRVQQDKVEITGGSKHFMAFGGGLRFCVGTDLSKVLIATFIHHLVTKYRWKTVKGGNIVRTPGLSFPDGFHVQFFPKN